MVDKIIYRKTRISQDETEHSLVLIFDNRSPFSLSSDSLIGVLNLYASFMVPIGYEDRFETIFEYEAAIASSKEDTINLFKKGA